MFCCEDGWDAIVVVHLCHFVSSQPGHHTLYILTLKVDYRLLCYSPCCSDYYNFYIIYLTVCISHTIMISNTRANILYVVHKSTCTLPIKLETEKLLNIIRVWNTYKTECCSNLWIPYCI